MFGSWNLLWGIAIYLLKVARSENIVLEIDEDYRRPVWNIAHMVNAINQVDYYIDFGANSLEFDVAFDWEGRAQYTYHGVPCDCFRSCLRYESFIPYIEYMRQLTTPGDPKYRKELALLFMDLKVHGLSPEAKMRAGEDVATKLLDHYWLRGNGANAYILISIPSIAHISFIQSFRRKLQSENFTQYDSRIGFDFSGNENLDSIRQAYASEEIQDRIWQGDGITNCLPRGTARLREALWRRDQSGVTFINKVYWWTVDKMSTMRTTLNMGVDGMITNYPDRLVSVLSEEEFSGKFRLATIDDNPWVKYASPTASLMNLLPKARGRNMTEFFKEDEELLYNC